MNDSITNVTSSVEPHDDRARRLLALWAACRDDNIERVRTTIMSGASDTTRLVNASSDDDKMPLMLASICGSEAIVQLLLDAGAAVDAAASDESTALHCAVNTGHAGVAELLLESGASINKTTTDGKTALLIASERGDVDTMRLLLASGAAVNVAAGSGEAPLYAACERGFATAALLLLQFDANINEPMRNDSTPLHAAIEREHLDLVHLLLDYGADVEYACQDRVTPLMHASKTSCDDIVRALLLRGGADVDRATSYGETALFGACSWRRLSNLRVLIEFNADIRKRTTDGWTLLHTAAEMTNNSEILEELLRDNTLVDLIDAKTDEGRTAISMVMRFGDGYDSMKVLWEAGASSDGYEEDIEYLKRTNNPFYWGYS